MKKRGPIKRGSLTAAALKIANYASFLFYYDAAN